MWVIVGAGALYFLTRPKATASTGPSRTDPIPQIPGTIAPGRPAEVSGMTQFRTRRAWAV